MVKSETSKCSESKKKKILHEVSVAKTILKKTENKLFSRIKNVTLFQKSHCFKSSFVYLHLEVSNTITKIYHSVDVS